MKNKLIPIIIITLFLAILFVLAMVIAKDSNEPNLQTKECQGEIYSNTEKGIQLCLPTNFEEHTYDDEILRIKFGPQVAFPGGAIEDPVAEYNYGYEISFLPYQSEEDKIKEYNGYAEKYGNVFVFGPEIIKINDFDVIKTIEGGFAGAITNYELIAPSFVLRLSDSGFGTTTPDDIFVKVINSIEFIK